MNRLILFVFLVSLGCSTTDKLNAYQAFGEKPGITQVVETLLENLLKDERTRSSFEKIDHERLIEKLVEQFCVELEGPCEYTGQSMARAHKGQDVTQAQYYALVENLQRSMEQNKIPFFAQTKLLGKLAPMYRDIVGK